MEVSTTKSRRPATCLTASLHHLVIATPTPALLANFYRIALGYDITERDGMVFAKALDRHLLLVPGQAKTLKAAGFAVPDRAELQRLRRRIDASQWPCRPGASPLFVESISVWDPDGTELIFGLAQQESALTTEAQTWSARLQHVVMSSRDPERVVLFFTEVL